VLLFLDTVVSFQALISFSVRVVSQPPTVPAAGEDIQVTSSKLPKSDFYRYSTRGPNEGKWELLSIDTKVIHFNQLLLDQLRTIDQGDGGIELAHDLALAIDSESQIIYAFGGEVYSYRRDTAKHYGSCCAYDIRTKEWRKLLYGHGYSPFELPC
jgi:hypothetical protein